MSVNKVILIGNVGRDPERKYFDNDVAKANFTLATSERGYTTAGGTQVPERTEWHNIVVWRGQAEIAEKYIKSGKLLYVEGRLRTNTYEDKETGAKKYFTEVYCTTFRFLGPSPSDGTTKDERTSDQSPSNSQKDDESLMPQPEDDLPF